jgi:hypothetical protein
MGILLFLSEAMVPLVLFYIVGFGILSGRPVLDDFIKGAKKRNEDDSRDPAGLSRPYGGGRHLARVGIP